MTITSYRCTKHLNGSVSIHLEWSIVPNASGYVVEYAIDRSMFDFPDGLDKVEVSGFDTLSVDMHDFTYGTTYYFRVKSIVDGVETETSTIVDIYSGDRASRSIDWTQSMSQSYEFYTVEPTTLADLKRLDNIKSASFSRDSDSETLGSATVDATNSTGETYIRGYLKASQNGVVEKRALGTVLVQTPSSTFNGIITNVSMDAYTPLIELKEKRPPLGYTLRKGTHIMNAASRIIRENARVPVNEFDISDETPTLQYDFVANTDDTWLSFVIDLIKNAKYQLDLDETGRILFSPIQEIESLQPVWTYDDGNSSILLPEITMDHDLFGIPNVVEVIYSYGNARKTAIARNDDPNSPVSTVSRGREIPYRDTSPSLAGYATDTQVQEYAERLLRSLSTIEYSVSYTHAYCPVRVGDCVRLNYEKAGIYGIKARVVSQNIKCGLPCQVSEKSVFTTKLWG